MYVYKNLNELMNEPILYVHEGDDCFYVEHDRDEGNTIWRVDKKTKSVSYMMFTDFICRYEKQTKRVPTSRLKELL